MTSASWLSGAWRYSLLLVCAFGLTGTGRAQALPAAEASPISTGFTLPSTSGTLQYAVSASESLTWGFYQNSGVASYTNLTGDLAYISNSTRDPFSALVAGGRSWANSGLPSYNFVSAALSQVVNVGRWQFVIADSADYLPSTPTTGIAGIAGLGDMGLTPAQVGAVGAPQGILSEYANRVDNTGTLSLQRPITGKTSINASGSYSISRYVGASSYGLDDDSLAASAGLMHQYSVRNGLGGSYTYSNYKFVGDLYGFPASNFTSQTAAVVYTHRFTRKLIASASAGPEWTSIHYLGTTNTLGLFANVTATYTGKLSSDSFTFFRGTNSGYGVIGGSVSDGLNFTASKTFGRVWNGAFTTSYTYSASLPTPGIPNYSFNTTLVGGQISRALGKSFSTYASYTYEDQSNQGSALAAVNVFSGSAQILGFGITYSPMAIHVGHQ